MSVTLSDFDIIGVVGRNSSPDRLHASVLVTHQILWMRKTRWAKISRTCPGNWYFEETGEYCPAFQAENLERAWRARNSQAMLSGVTTPFPGLI